MEQQLHHGHMALTSSQMQGRSAIIIRGIDRRALIQQLLDGRYIPLTGIRQQQTGLAQSMLWGAVHCVVGKRRNSYGENFGTHKPMMRAETAKWRRKCENWRRWVVCHFECGGGGGPGSAGGCPPLIGRGTRGGRWCRILWCASEYGSIFPEKGDKNGENGTAFFVCVQAFLEQANFTIELVQKDMTNQIFTNKSSKPRRCLH